MRSIPVLATHILHNSYIHHTNNNISYQYHLLFEYIISIYLSFL